MKSTTEMPKINEKVVIKTVFDGLQPATVKGYYTNSFGHMTVYIVYDNASLNIDSYAEQVHVSRIV